MGHIQIQTFGIWFYSSCQHISHKAQKWRRSKFVRVSRRRKNFGFWCLFAFVAFFALAEVWESQVLNINKTSREKNQTTCLCLCCNWTPMTYSMSITFEKEGNCVRNAGIFLRERSSRLPAPLFCRSDPSTWHPSFHAVNHCYFCFAPILSNAVKILSIAFLCPNVLYE